MSRPARENARRLPRRKLLAAAIVTALLVALVAVLGPAMLHRASDPVARSGPELRPTPIETSLDRGPGAGEIALWNNARQADSEALLRQYLHEYPRGEFAPLAAAKLRGLETQDDPGYGAVAAAEAPPRGGSGSSTGGPRNSGMEEEPGASAEPPTDPAAAAEPEEPRPAVPAPAAPPPAVVMPAPAPAPVAPASPPPGTVTVERFPTLDAPAEAVVGAEIEVLVALTEEQFTPDVTVRPGADTAVTAEGALAIANLPESEDGWLLHVDLVATGFEVADGGSWIAEMRLNRHGDSDYVRYRLRALPISGEARPGRIQARFNLGGRYLGSVSRPVTIVAAPAGTAALAPAGFAAANVPLAGPVTLEGGEDEDYDLNIVVRYDDPVALGRAVVTFMSDHVAPSEEVIYTSPDLPTWLEGEYRRLTALGGVRGATSLASPTRPQGSGREIAEAVAAGLGRQLYDFHMPQRFKALFWHLKDQDQLRSIQVTSNSSAIPWELVKPVRPDGSGADEFLGVGYRLARWSLRDTPGQIDVPRERLPFSGIAAIAPPYEGGAFLPSQQREVDALSQIPGFRRLGGDFGAVRDLLSAGGESFVHFSGHGEISEPGAGRPVFSIRLTDTLLDPGMWQAIALPGTGGNFYFFNACDTGRSGRIGGFVQGWGPALLQSGASGFIGGMWPLPDASAADFSAAFYATLSRRLRDGPVHLADVLREVRARFHETGDPTYLAYTYYGNANLRVTRP